MSKRTMSNIERGLRESIKWVKSLSPEDAARLDAMQRASFVRAISSGPPKMGYVEINGRRVFGCVDDAD